MLRKIKGFERYFISDSGDVFSTIRPKGELRPMRPCVTRQGYHRIGLRNEEGKCRWFSVHSLVLEAFVCKRPKGLIACHRNGEHSDNKVSNLRWDTYKANEADKLLHGTRAIHERHGLAKLTMKKAELIRASSLSQCALAREYRVNKSTIRDVLLGRTWLSSAAAELERKP